MRVALVHNDAAGDATSVSGVARAISRHGHDIVAVTHPAAEMAAIAGLRVDLLAVAGGDGTVAAAAFALADAAATIPMAILPLGTANNTATSLGVPADADAAVAAWATSVVRPFDLGRATGPWGERRFLESVGGGLVTHGIVVMDRRDYTSPSTEAQMARARHAFADVLAQLAAAPWDLAIDGTIVGESFLLVEVLNIGLIGPNLRLAHTSPSDGELAVVAAPAESRDELRAALANGRPGCAPSGLRTWRAREVTITRSDRLHVDDAVMDHVGVAPVRIGVDAAAISVLRPGS